jgi:hypothetical protein
MYNTWIHLHVGVGEYVGNTRGWVHVDLYRTWDRYVDLYRTYEYVEYVCKIRGTHYIIYTVCTWEFSRQCYTSSGQGMTCSQGGWIRMRTMLHGDGGFYRGGSGSS